VRPRA